MQPNTETSIALVILSATDLETEDGEDPDAGVDTEGPEGREGGGGSDAEGDEVGDGGNGDGHTRV